MGCRDGSQYTTHVLMHTRHGTITLWHDSVAMAGICNQRRNSRGHGILYTIFKWAAETIANRRPMSKCIRWSWDDYPLARLYSHGRDMHVVVVASILFHVGCSAIRWPVHAVANIRRSWDSIPPKHDSTAPAKTFIVVARPRFHADWPQILTQCMQFTLAWCRTNCPAILDANPEADLVK